jgi:hypothetical protein
MQWPVEAWGFEDDIFVTTSSRECFNVDVERDLVLICDMLQLLFHFLCAVAPHVRITIVLPRFLTHSLASSLIVLYSQGNPIST